MSWHITSLHASKSLALLQREQTELQILFQNTEGKREKWDWFCFKWLEPDSVWASLFLPYFFGFCLSIRKYHLDSTVGLNQELKLTKRRRKHALSTAVCVCQSTLQTGAAVPGPHAPPWESQLRSNRKKKWFLWFQESNLILLWKVMVFVVIY